MGWPILCEHGRSNCESYHAHAICQPGRISTHSRHYRQDNDSPVHDSDGEPQCLINEGMGKVDQWSGYWAD